MATTNKSNVYDLVTERIIEQMNKGIIPWQKPWNIVATNGTNSAINYVTRKAYSPLNQMLLGESGEYLTWKQIESLKGKVKKGANSHIVVFYTTTEYTREIKDTDETGKETTRTEEYKIPVLKYYRVFHLSDTENIPSKITPDEICEPEPEQAITAAENIINDYVFRESFNGFKFQNNKPSNEAYFSPAHDKVVVPMKKQFKSLEAYYATTFHELTHSTLTANRCNRVQEGAIARFGSKVYSREELVAEIGSAMLCTIAGISTKDVFDNSVAYIQGWIKSLKNDNKMIVWAASRAEKAALYIQNLNPVTK